MKCEYCGEEVLMPFKCRYCGGYFCAEHRLPEKHNCPGLFAAASPHEKELKEIRATIREEGYGVKLRRRGWSEAAHLTAGALLVVLAGFSLIGYNIGLHIWILVLLIGGFAASFLLHELAHRTAARRYGLRAGFRLDPTGSILTLITSLPFIPFKIIAPGAVVVSGLLTISIMGWISLAGPLANIVLSAVFLNLYIASLQLRNILLAYAFMKLTQLNAFIALFNLIPFGPLDGVKVLAWSRWRWVVSLAASIALLAFSYFF